MVAKPPLIVNRIAGRGQDDCKVASTLNPLVLSLSKDGPARIRKWFDKLTTNGF